MSKRIVLIANAAFTLTNFRRELMQHLVTEGYQVTVVCPETCHLTTGSIRSIFTELNVEYVPINFQRNGINPIKDLRFMWDLKCFFSATKPDVVLNYTIKPFIYSSIVAKFCGVKYVCSNVTGLGYLFTEQSLKVRLLRSIIKLQLSVAAKCNSLIFFQNPDDRQDYLAHKITRPDTLCKIINGSGVSLNQFAYEPKQKSRVVRFLFIARLLKDKGINEFSAAAKQVKLSHPNAYFDIVGPFDSNPNALSKKHITDLQTQGIIKYHGATDDVLPFLEACDVFVLPSYREGTPRTVLEAMAVGRPIITTDAPGCKECVTEGVNGFLVPVKNVELLVEAMIKLLDNPDLRTLMGDASRKFAEEKYDVNLVVKEIVSGIESL